MSFRGQVAVITGGGSGMGQAWARRLAKDGATVAILDVNEAGMAETAASASNIKPYVVDITDADGNILILTGYTVAGQIRKNYDSSTFTAFTGSVSNAAMGKITLALTSTQTNALVAGRYVYDIEITSSGSAITRVLEGQLEVTPGVTR